MSAQAGFTLVETLVVAAILSVLAVGATLAVSNRAGAQSDAARFARIFADTRHRAVVGQRALALVPGTDGLGLLREGPGGWSTDTPAQPWRGRVALAGGSIVGDTPAPAIILLPTGQTSAFSLAFSGSGAPVTCRTDGWTDLTCDAG